MFRFFHYVAQHDRVDNYHKATLNGLQETRKPVVSGARHRREVFNILTKNRHRDSP